MIRERTGLRLDSEKDQMNGQQAIVFHDPGCKSADDQWHHVSDDADADRG
jgi:hypothetical protein